MAQAVNLGGSQTPIRLSGALKAGTVIATGAAAKERIFVRGAASISVRYKAASITGTCTSNIHPMLTDAGRDDTVGTRAVTGLPTPVTSAPTTEQVITYTTLGEDYVEFALSMSAGGSDTVTLSYVDVYIKPIV